MMKTALFALLSILLLPVASFANGVERGQDVEVPAPAFTPFLQHLIAQEVSRRCDLPHASGAFTVAQVRPQGASFAGDKLIYRAKVNLESGEDGSTDSLIVTAAEEIGNAPRILEISSERCSSY
jgi:hypothetical protein